VASDFENGVSLGEMAEADVLARIFPRLPESTSTLLGPGDDAAVVAAPDGRFVVTTDMMVEGPDFRREFSSAEDIGFKIAAVNLADVAAMGATPTALVVALGAPAETDVAVLESIADGLRLACESLAPSCGVVGGDLSSAPVLTLSVTAFGDLAGREPLTRSGARPGDVIAVAGELGAAGIGLEMLFAAEGPDEFSQVGQNPLTRAQLRPHPPIALGVTAAVTGATAAMDVSDGLVLDASRIAKASGVSMVFDELGIAQCAAQIAVEALKQGFSDDEIVEHVLYSGESHALLTTFPIDQVLPLGFTPIGTVIAQAAEPVYFGNRPLPIRGWNPFSY
jgi:thiamine-monophosphate kinase